LFANLIFALVRFSARKGLAETDATVPSEKPLHHSKKRALRTGVRGETYAYWYLRRQGYTMVARNYTFPGLKGEIDMVGFDGPVVAFIEVKTRSVSGTETGEPSLPSAEQAVDGEKRRNLQRVARQFLRIRRIEDTPHRFDVLAIETQIGMPPSVRLHKGSFRPQTEQSY
jgi:putative endonuclease